MSSPNNESLLHKIRPSQWGGSQEWSNPNLSRRGIELLLHIHTEHTAYWLQAISKKPWLPVSSYLIVFSLPSWLVYYLFSLFWSCLFAGKQISKEIEMSESQILRTATRLQDLPALAHGSRPRTWTTCDSAGMRRIIASKNSLPSCGRARLKR